MIRNGHTRNYGLARHHAQKKTAVALSAGLAEKAGVLCQEHLARESGGQPVFGPITVEPATSHSGEEVFPAAIVCDGTEHATNASQAARRSPHWQPLRESGTPSGSDAGLRSRLRWVARDWRGCRRSRGGGATAGAFP